MKSEVCPEPSTCYWELAWNTHTQVLKYKILVAPDSEVPDFPAYIAVI